MIIDHINAICFDHKVIWMYLLGRGAFPLFCYAVAASYLRGIDRGRYISRLLIFAVLSQPFFYFSFGPPFLANVLFTLALGVAVADFSDDLPPWQMNILYIIAAASMWMRMPIEFGLAGIMLPSAIIRVQRGENLLPFLLLLLFTINQGGLGENLGKAKTPEFAVAVIGLATTFVPAFALYLAKDLQQKGRLLPKYALHVFYPVHMTLIKLATLAVK